MSSRVRFISGKIFVRCCGIGLLAVLLCLLPTVLSSQMTARGLGMGGAYTALARGVHAPAWNPANLGLSDNSKFSFTFISVETGVWNNSFNKEIYDKYFVSEEDEIYWTQQDVEDILNQIPDDGFGLNVGASFGTFSFSAGRFAFTLGVDAGVRLQLDHTLFELPLKGTSPNKTYELHNMDVKGLGIGLIGISWGQPLKVPFASDFAVGGTVHIFYGGGYGEVDTSEITLHTGSHGFDLNGEYKATYALGNINIGWGIDLGTAARFGNWQLSLGLSNVMSSIPWSEKIEHVEGYITGDSLNVLNITENDEEEDVFSDSSWTTKGERFSTNIPTVLRLGCAYEIGSYFITADYIQGFQEGAWTTTKPQIALGSEWKGVKWLPMRMGVVLGGRLGFGTAFGFGIRPGGFVLDIGLMNRGFFTERQ